MARSRWQPSKKDRVTVAAMSAGGIDQQTISACLGISRPTLEPGRYRPSWRQRRREGRGNSRTCQKTPVSFPLRRPLSGSYRAKACPVHRYTPERARGSVSAGDR
jgi:hypothetical protein